MLGREGIAGPCLSLPLVERAIPLDNIPQRLKPMLNLRQLTARVNSCPFKAAKSKEFLRRLKCREGRGKREFVHPIQFHKNSGGCTQ